MELCCPGGAVGGGTSQVARVHWLSLTSTWSSLLKLIKSKAKSSQNKRQLVFSLLLFVQLINTSCIFTPGAKRDFGSTVIFNGICSNKIISNLCLATLCVTLRYYFTIDASRTSDVFAYFLRNLKQCSMECCRVRVEKHFIAVHCATPKHATS